MLVVKDDAYGHGLVGDRAARVVTTECCWFGAFDVQTVAATSSSVLGDDARVFVWVIGTSDQEAASAVARRPRRRRRRPGSPRRGSRDRRAADAAATARVHLKVDSGLHRNGVRLEDWAGFAARAREWERAGTIEVVGVWSHIAEAILGHDR